MKVLVTLHALHNFHNRILKISVDFKNFSAKFLNNKEFSQETIEKFEDLFYNNLENAAIYRKTDSIYITGNFTVILESAIKEKNCDLVLKTIQIGFPHLRLRKHKMPKHIDSKMFDRETCEFLYHYR